MFIKIRKPKPCAVIIIVGVEFRIDLQCQTILEVELVGEALSNPVLAHFIDVHIHVIEFVRKINL